MELFLISNCAITLVTILYNRYAQANVSAKLILSTFALVCWVVPFTLVRDFLPQNVALNVHWIIPQVSNNETLVNTIIETSFLDQISLNKILLVLSLIGVLVFFIQLYQHFNWIKRLKNDPETKRVSHYKNTPVYSSNLISNALLIGYQQPEIWVNPKIIDSPYLDIVLEHETTHIKYKDNYWLALIELIKKIYWWNPLLKILIANLKELLETRCDYKSSLAFTEGIYQQKLTELILSDLVSSELISSSLVSANLMQKNMPVASTGLVSAVMSKNSNIKRLKSLKEKQNMNLFSKLMVSLLLISGIVILTFPVSSSDIFASNKSQKINQESDDIKLNFDQIPVDALAQILAEFLDVKTRNVTNDLKSKLISIQLEGVPKEKILNKLTQLTNIEFKIINDQLEVRLLAGGINQSVTKPMSKEQVKPMTKDQVMLEFTILSSQTVDSKIQEVKTKFSILANYSKQASVEIAEHWKIELIPSKISKNIFLKLKLFELNGKQQKLVAEPEISFKFNEEASVSLNQENGKQITLNVLAKEKAHLKK